MENLHGLPASELSDTELWRQGSRAHATRSWVFLHGTRSQYRHHTERMLELEQEYLRRHPQRTWQGTADDETPVTVGDRIEQIQQVLRHFESEMSRLLTELTELTNAGDLTELTDATRKTAGELPTATEAKLLARYAEAPAGRLHKLEAHHAARELGLHPSRVAQLYRQDPPLLAVDGVYRFLTEDGRAALVPPD